MIAKYDRIATTACTGSPIERRASTPGDGEDRPMDVDGHAKCAQAPMPYPLTESHHGVGCSVVLNRYWLSKSVFSPGRLPLTGCRRADNGLCHLYASAATSPKIFTRRSSLTS